MADAKRDQNSVVTLIGVSSADGVTPVVIYVDPVTHRLLVNSTGGGGTPGGSTTQVQYNNAGAFGGITGATTNGTTLTLVAPVLGAATATSINGLIISTTTGTLTIANGKTVTINNTLTFNGTDSATVNFAAGGTVAYTGTSLAQFAATTSAQLAGIISDETGSGSLVFATSPTLVTPVLGVATATSINGLTISTSTGTFTLTNGKTFAVQNSLTLAGTDGTVMTFPSTSASIARIDAAQSFTGVQTFLNAINESQGSNIASASTTDIGAATGTYVNVTGTVTITALGTVQAGTRRIVQFSGALILTYNVTSLILPTAANITTVAGDTACFISLGSGNWKCVWYQRADGTALTASAAAASTTTKQYYTFDAVGRYNQTTNASGTATIDQFGANSFASTTAGSYAYWDWQIAPGATSLYDKSPACSMVVYGGNLSANDADFIIGLGIPTIASAGITFTNRHIGFKLQKRAGTTSLYATQADGTTENASSALTTIATGDMLELYFKVNSSTSVDYYWRKNGGALSSATNLTSNMPSLSSGDVKAQFGVTNRNTADFCRVTVLSFTYER